MAFHLCPATCKNFKSEATKVYLAQAKHGGESMQSHHLGLNKGWKIVHDLRPAWAAETQSQKTRRTVGVAFLGMGLVSYSSGDNE